MRFAILSSLLLAPAALAQSSFASGSASSSAASASASAAAPSGMAAGNSSDYLTAVLGALTQAGLTSLVGVASSIANTTDGMALLGQLGQGNKTVFAPSNDAFSSVNESVSSNTTLLTQILSYHILNNTYSVNGTMVAPNHTIARTLLRGASYNLPGNRTAPLVLARNSTDATSFNIVQAASNVTAMGGTMAANLMVYVIDEVLTLPLDLASAATQFVPSLAGVIRQANLLAPLASSTGLTVFAPVDAAISGAMELLGTLNSSQVTSVLSNHVINGTVVYSNALSTSHYTSAGGQPFMFMNNATGAYVMSANSTARIIQSDVIINNGVIHLIDNVLANPMSDPEAAASAFSSGTAAAATMTEPTAPVTNTSPAMTAGGSGSDSGSMAPSGAAGKLSPLGLGPVAGAIAAAVAAVMGGALVFA